MVHCVHVAIDIDSNIASV